MNSEMDMLTMQKWLRLLFSDDPDSTDQMRIMLEETIKTKYGVRVQLNLSGLGVNNNSDSSNVSL